VFFGTEGSLFFCVDWRRAAAVWTFEDKERQQPLRGAPAVSAGKVVFGGRSKKVYCLDAQDGHLLWEFSTRQRVDASPVIVKDRVFAAAGDGRIYGLDLNTGKESWQFEAGGGFTGSPAVASQRLVIASEDGVVYCFGSKS
jgi:outer membrane protein assembly factor BamB